MSQRCSETLVFMPTDAGLELLIAGCQVLKAGQMERRPREESERSQQKRELTRPDLSEGVQTRCSQLCQWRAERVPFRSKQRPRRTSGPLTNHQISLFLSNKAERRASCLKISLLILK